MIIVSWSVYGAMWQWPILVAKVELCFDGWNFTRIRKFVKKSFFLRNLGKNTSEPLKNISCFRIVMLFPNCWRNKFFSAVIFRCTISLGKHGYEPPKHKMPPFSQHNFFRHFWYFSVTKAIHSYVLTKFEKILIFSFSTPFLDFHRRPLWNHFLSFIQCSDIV